MFETALEFVQYYPSEFDESLAGRWGSVETYAIGHWFVYGGMRHTDAVMRQLTLRNDEAGVIGHTLGDALTCLGFS